jgi:outer membrane lipoprotein SlyB
MNRFFIRCAAAATVLALGACATSSPDVISRNDAQRLSTVTDAVVLAVRPVVIDGNQSGLGGAAGGIAGAIAGGGVGGRRESGVASVLGAVVGGVIGNTVERASTKEDAFEITLQMKNGDRRAVIQAKGTETFSPGDSVILVSTGGKVRVMRAPAVTAPAATPPTS